MSRLGSVLSKSLSALSAVAVVAALAAAPVVQAEGHVSQTFAGAKANKGTVSFMKEGEKIVLTLSNDFVVPDTPAPHWQVVDSKGNVYLLQRLKIRATKGDKYNQTITVPRYVKDVAKVQIWCAWAETLLGEAPFDSVQS